MSDSAEVRQVLIRYGVLAVVVLLLLVSIGWNVLSPDPSSVRIAKPQLSDLLVTWRCLECGYETEAPAGPGPVDCPDCGKEAMFVSVRFSCPEHGLFPVAFNYDDGQPSEVKVADGPWVPYLDAKAGTIGTVCPECGRSMLAVEAPRSVNNTSE